MNDSHLILLILILFSKYAKGTENEFYTCLNSTTHKKYPTQENKLYKQCAVWENLSCCDEETSVRIHSLKSSENSLYNFNYEQCPENNYTKKCQEFFINDLCFYQCSPYNLPWIINAPMKIRNERFYQVPLCLSECNAWFEACQYDYTCSNNWGKNFIWNSKTGNQCLKDIPCSTISDIFGNATNFCEKIWNDSWKVVDDSIPCMKLQSKTSTHNKLVGIHYGKKYKYISPDSASLIQIQVFILIISLLLIYYI